MDMFSFRQEANDQSDDQDNDDDDNDGFVTKDLEDSQRICLMPKKDD